MKTNTDSYLLSKDINLVDQNVNPYESNGAVSLTLDRPLPISYLDKPTEVRVAVAVLTDKEWAMLKYANWLIGQHKLDKGNRQKLRDYWKGKELWEEVVSGRYGKRIQEQETERNKEKQRKSEGRYLHGLDSETETAWDIQTSLG